VEKDKSWRKEGNSKKKSPPPQPRTKKSVRGFFQKVEGTRLTWIEKVQGRRKRPRSFTSPPSALKLHWVTTDKPCGEYPKEFCRKLQEWKNEEER